MITKNKNEEIKYGCKLKSTKMGDMQKEHALVSVTKQYSTMPNWIPEREQQEDYLMQTVH